MGKKTKDQNQDLMRGFTVKRIKGKKYFYYYIRTPFLKKEIYVGRYSTDPEQLLKYYFEANLKATKFVLEALDKRKYAVSVLTQEETRMLDFLRYIYVKSLEKYSKADLERLEDILFTRYVHGTTSIEGNTYSLRETDITLNEGLTVGGKTAREFWEIKNYAELKQQMKSPKRTRITPALIKRIHKILLKNIDDESAGRFRNIEVGIRGTEFVPTPHILIEKEVRKLCEWYTHEKTRRHPLELIGEFHVRFEQIHPFKDGNGRVGRELMRLQLKENQFPTVFIGSSNREAYLKALDQSETDYSPFIRFLHKTLLAEFQQLHRTMFKEVFASIEELLTRSKSEKSLSTLETEILELKKMVKELEQIAEKLFEGMNKPFT